MNKISYSQLSMFTECPLRWKLNYVDDLSIFEYNIYLIFGNAVHEVLQKYLEVLYYDSAKNADLLDLNEMLRDRLIENFKIAKEHDDKACCTKEDLQEFFEDGVAIIDFVKKRIGHTFWRKEEPEKHRYLYLLCGKKDKKKIMNTLIHKSKPYPKDAYQFYPEIQTIEVENKESFYE